MSVTKGSSLNEKMDDEENSPAHVNDEPSDDVNGFVDEIVAEVDNKLNLEDEIPQSTDMDDFSTDTVSEASVLTIETKEPDAIDNEEIEKLEMAKRRVSLSLPIDENDKFIVTPSSPGMAVDGDGVGASERTKKFLESDDAIISQIFSQTITSAGVTPTEDYDFSTGPLPDLITNEVLYATSPSEDVEDDIGDDDVKTPEPEPEPEEYEDEEMDDFNATDMHSKQRPSIVIDCYDESQERVFPYYEEPVTPNEKDIRKSFEQFDENDDSTTSNAIKTEPANENEETIVVTITDNTVTVGSGCYFDQTIDCDDDEDVVVDGIEAAKSSSEDITKSGSINEESNDDDEEDGSQIESVVEHFENNETSAITTEKVAKTKKVVRKTTKTSSTTSSTTTTSATSATAAASETTEIKATVAAATTDKTVVEKIGKTNGVTLSAMETITTTSNGSVEVTSNGNEIMDDDTSDSPKKSPTKLTKKKSDAGGKKKVKKSKKSDEKENISVQGSNQTTPEAGTEKNCRSCGKVVFQMEQVKAERNIWHKNCFRCQECNKQLNVDAYQSHESVLYCKPHFKALFAPKVVAESDEPAPRRKPELIIRENQPDELPADVVRSSAKQDLGLEECQSSNVKSRFQVFENYKEEHETNSTLDRSPSSGVQRSASIMSKLARFHAKGMDVGISDDVLNGVALEEYSEASESDDGDDDVEDIELIRARRAARKERPISLNNMNDIKSRFEGNSELGREERREERKQEIQSIRSRLFMGKQAKIKEMYQQAVADSEQGIVASGKKSEIDIGDKAKSLKEKFERGEIFNCEENGENGQNGQTNGIRSKHSHTSIQEDSAVFEEGYSKKSRSIFLELDAAAAATPSSLQRSSSSTTPRTPEIRKLNPMLLQQQQPENYVKSDDKIEDVVIETADVSSKFKFFETYKPGEKEKRQFRITPPREGVVKLPSPEKEIYRDPDIVRSDSRANDMDDSSVAENTHTASKVLSLFRQMEQKQHQPTANDGLKPLKRFTPPPDADRRRAYDDSDEEKNVTDSEEEEEEDDEEEEETEEDEDRPRAYDDEFLKAAKSAARAKQLRDKFEKWETKEIEREQTNGSISLCEPADQDFASQVESAKSLRAKFESLRDSGSQIQRDTSRVKVNRFVKEDQP